MKLSLCWLLAAGAMALFRMALAFHPSPRPMLYVERALMQWCSRDTFEAVKNLEVQRLCNILALSSLYDLRAEHAWTVLGVQSMCIHSRRLCTAQTKIYRSLRAECAVVCLQDREDPDSRLSCTCIPVQHCRALATMQLDKQTVHVVYVSAKMRIERAAGASGYDVYIRSSGRKGVGRAHEQAETEK